ncbi:MAG: anaerobic ribonucleoside-triphosphate reductase activating protein, partial [Armatimonadetes bacterium]|nr:anaerobic ribonucleoside-triphosphate reductase activating protein [Armatimonadota bacterium]
MAVMNGMQRTSFIDYPGKIVSTVFFGRCNFRCPYCHNSDLVFNRDLPEIEGTVLLEHLENRRGKLDGICITGGEPTLHPDLPDFIRAVKERGFLVKLDSNGTNPGMLEELFDENLVDYMAMDIKAPKEKYPEITGVKVNMEPIQRSIDVLRKKAPDYEFRTTAVRELTDEGGLMAIAKWIAGSKRYVLQQF